MTHRPGHIESAGDGTASMDRRKYLSTLAAGAAFGTVAAGLAACNTSPREQAKQPSTDSTSRSLIATPQCTTLRRWGYLSIFPPAILTLAEARANMPAAGAKMIRVPFFNSNGIELTEKMVVGFHLVRIGCPSIFAVAFNLYVEDPDADHDHDPIDDSEREALIRRNTNMDKVLRTMGYVESEWKEPDGKQCDDPPADWSQ
jgi:hypothetical protein